MATNDNPVNKAVDVAFASTGGAGKALKQVRAIAKLLGGVQEDQFDSETLEAALWAIESICDNEIARQEEAFIEAARLIPEDRKGARA